MKFVREEKKLRIIAEERSGRLTIMTAVCEVVFV
jgi:hypothetical protein